MNKYKRVILVVAVINVLAASALTGCSSKKLENVKKTSKPISVEKTETSKYGNYKGCLWEIRKGKAKVYLFGSIHIGKKEMYPFEKTVEDAFSSCDNLVVEYDSSKSIKVNLDESELMYPENDDVYNHISKEDKEKLDSCAKEAGLDMNMLKRMKLYLIIANISNIQTEKAGYSVNYGIDSYFINKGKNKKKILELESKEFQDSLLNDLTDAEQKNGLLLLKDMKTSQAENDKFFEAFKAGDEKELVKLSGDTSKLDASYYKKMFADRNAGMARKIDGYLKTNESYFVVAGLSHFIGDASVVDLLQHNGYTVIKR